MSTPHLHAAALAGRRAVVDVEPWLLELTMPTDGWLTANERITWPVRARRTRVLRRLAGLRARQAGCPELQAAHVALWFRFRDNRRRDVGNLAPTAKALVDAHLLLDDDDARLLGPDLRRGPRVVEGRPLVQVLVYTLALAAVCGTSTPPCTAAPRRAQR